MYFALNCHIWHICHTGLFTKNSIEMDNFRTQVFIRNGPNTSHTINEVAGGCTQSDYHSTKNFHRKLLTPHDKLRLWEKVWDMKPVTKK